uniref:Uncharacterized protein n=1 Tax=Arundo donax TaxID=35708 RepID=A0A0A9GJ69_ARUDO
MKHCHNPQPQDFFSSKLASTKKTWLIIGYVLISKGNIFAQAHVFGRCLLEENGKQAMSRHIY